MSSPSARHHLQRGPTYGISKYIIPLTITHEKKAQVAQKLGYLRQGNEPVRRELVALREGWRHTVRRD